MSNPPAPKPTRAKPALDLPEVLAYAKSKGIGVWLWVQWHQLDQATAAG